MMTFENEQRLSNARSDEIEFTDKTRYPLKSKKNILQGLSVCDLYMCTKYASRGYKKQGELTAR